MVTVGGALALHGAGVGRTVLVKNLRGAAQEIFSFAQGCDGSQFNMADWNAKEPFDG